MGCMSLRLSVYLCFQIPNFKLCEHFTTFLGCCLYFVCGCWKNDLEEVQVVDELLIRPMSNEKLEEGDDEMMME